MKKKAIILIGLKSRIWLCQELGINPITLQKRLNLNNWKISEKTLLDQIYDRETKDL
jgi:hypothetical protein